MRRNFLEDKFNIATIRFEFAQDFIDQGAVFDNEKMRIKNAGVLRSNRLGDALLHVENLRTRLDKRGLEATNFVRDLARLDAVTRHIVHFFAHYMDPPTGNTRRYAHPVKTDFLLRVIATHFSCESSAGVNL